MPMSKNPSRDHKDPESDAITQGSLYLKLNLVYKTPPSNAAEGGSAALNTRKLIFKGKETINRGLHAVAFQDWVSG